MADTDYVNTGAFNVADSVDSTEADQANALGADADLFELIAAVRKADAAVKNASRRAVRDGPYGRSKTKIDAAVTASKEAYALALDELATCTPRTLAGVTAMLAALAAINPPDEGYLPTALARLAGCPALATGVDAT